MKAILEFNLPEENVEFEQANNGAVAFSILSAILENLRKKLKYQELSESEYRTIENIKNEIIQEINECEVMNILHEDLE